MNLHLALRDDRDGCRPVPTDAGLLCLRIKHLKPNKSRFTVSSAFIYIQTPLYRAEKKKIRHVVFISRQLLGFVLVRGNPAALCPQFYTHTLNNCYCHPQAVAWKETSEKAVSAHHRTWLQETEGQHRLLQPEKIWRRGMKWNGVGERQLEGTRGLCG